mmetsp:Transcript_33600/g.94529  ORF Transcript_33600/g.94529 Transcript_33600/m.94529 type:complete len:221 (-) Transcript_33600:274-936(-)
MDSSNASAPRSSSPACCSTSPPDSSEQLSSLLAGRSGWVALVWSLSSRCWRYGSFVTSGFCHFSFPSRVFIGRDSEPVCCSHFSFVCRARFFSYHSSTPASLPYSSSSSDSETSISSPPLPDPPPTAALSSVSSPAEAACAATSSAESGSLPLSLAPPTGATGRASPLPAGGLSGPSPPALRACLRSRYLRHFSSFFSFFCCFQVFGASASGSICARKPT